MRYYAVQFAFFTAEKQIVLYNDKTPKTPHPDRVFLIIFLTFLLKITGSVDVIRPPPSPIPLQEIEISRSEGSDLKLLKKRGCPVQPD